MKLRADRQGRIACREFFPPEAAFDVTRQPDGSVRVMELVEKKAPRAKLVRRGGRTFLVSGKVITNADVQRALEEFP